MISIFKRRCSMSCWFAAAVVLIGAAVQARAQSTAFVYQGQLLDNGSPAAGLHDFRFSLFDAASGGTRVGTTQCVDNVTVTGGLFTASVDFGNQFTTTAQRFIEIEVRRDTGQNCSNTTGFTTLATRQLIAATPIATHAKSAFSLDAANGSIANAVFVDNSGKVGVGTLAPTHTLHIASTAPTLALQDTDSSSQQVGYVSFRDSTSTERAWIGFGTAGDPDLTVLNARFGGDLILNTLGGGNIGIGTASPRTKLEVNGDVRLGNAGQYFAPAGHENFRILAGVIDNSGSIEVGSGFTCQRLDTGRYRITYDTPFPARPVVTATPNDEGTGIPITTASINRNYNPALFPNYVEISITRRSDGAFEDRTFHFIVVGLH